MHLLKNIIALLFASHVANAFILPAPLHKNYHRMSLKMAASTANSPTITVNRNDAGLITPHGGELRDLIIKDDAAKQAAIDSCTTSLQLSDRQMCDVELIMNGGFSPLTGFMNQKEYEHVVENMRLTSGELFGLPVIFDSDDESLKVGDKILLKQGDRPIATFEVEDKYLPDKPKECLKIPKNVLQKVFQKIRKTKSHSKSKIFSSKKFLRRSRTGRGSSRFYVKM